jgi:spermidine/putrescine transport system substrate-binding protein
MARLARREFLRRSALLGVALPSAGAILAACGDDDDEPSSGSKGSNASTTTNAGLSRPDNPVTLPLKGEPIADGLDPEGGPLKLFNYDAYINPDTVKAFEKQFGVKVEITTFTSMDEARSKLTAGVGDFDVFFPTADVVARVVEREQLQPLNHTYLPNVANVWPSLQDPFYDKGSQYTVPYTLYTTGIGYRIDKVDRVPDDYDNPYDILWDSANKGTTWLLEDDRETLGMALLRKGVTDVNTEDADLLAAALADLQELDDNVSAKTSVAAYEKLPSGEASVHQAWSGDAVNAQYYLPKGTDIEQIGYWYPSDHKGIIGSDSIAVVAGAKNPVLAHAFLNFMLDKKNALENYTWLGYQPPQTSIDPESVVADGIVPAHLTTAVIRPEDFDTGYQLLQLTPDGEDLWDAAYAKFKSGS